METSEAPAGPQEITPQPKNHSNVSRIAERLTDLFGNRQERLEEDTVANRYLDELGLTWEDLRGKRVLDVGAGQALFAKAAKRMGIEVISTDLYPGGMGEHKDMPRGIQYMVGDFKEGIDLPDESFDVIVSYGAVVSPKMVEIQEDLSAVIKEAKRLLKPDGEFRFGPGMSQIKKIREGEQAKYLQVIAKKRAGKELSADEQELYERVAIPTQEELEYDYLPDEVKHDEVALTQWRRGACHWRLQQIDPNITEHEMNRSREVRRGNTIFIIDNWYYTLRKDTTTKTVG